ncbi:hypothetical protein R1flu_015919 [Riccia fluitans]|uniref:ER-bound oxygenase mpaB/mpaB'/Rubber oxygenase catalytic domain-containing protein n=1 Tax=Riccia fluitans TaxID=41844 RepID=A0ABD1YKC4_9MARC
MDIDQLLPAYSRGRFEVLTLVYAALLVICIAISCGFLIRTLLPPLKLILSSSSSEAKGFPWRNRYPSFDDMHAFFDRGDAMLASALIAVSLQLSDKQVGAFIRAHSTFKTHPWRRIIRTLAFMRMTVRANSAQRSEIIAWLNRIHKNMRLYQFDTNVFILATIAFGFAKAHEILGCATDVELDGMVSAIMSMAYKINPEDRGKPVPTSLIEVEMYLSSMAAFNSPDLEKTYDEAFQLANVRRRYVKGINAKTFFRKPFSWIKLLLLQRLVRGMGRSILFPRETHRHSGLLLSVAQLFQPVWYHLHYNTCPHSLTFDGLFDLLVDCDPSLKDEVDGVYKEVFGEDHAAIKAQKESAKTMRAHLPQVANSTVGEVGRELEHPSLSEAVLEHLICAYYRARLSSSVGVVPQHLGVIMDGNRRYSKANRLGSVIEGHRIGARRLLQFMSWSFSAGINNLTMWALSDDNLKRGREELEPLFAMMTGYISEILSGNTSISVLALRFRVVGDRSLLPEELRLAVEVAETATECNRKFNFQLAMGYGGQAEVVRAVKKAVKWRAKDERTSTEEALENLSARDISEHTYSAELGLPAIDAILRTGGERRLSGFALWETQMAELCFASDHWPGMKQSDFLRSLVDLSERQRRFGA